MKIFLPSSHYLYLSIETKNVTFIIDVLLTRFGRNTFKWSNKAIKSFQPAISNQQVHSISTSKA